MHIGIVEDNAIVLEMVKVALMLHGHQVEGYSSASSFFAALKKVEHLPPYDLVIVDIMLGRQLGTEIVDVLYTTRPAPIPVILMSAGAESLLASIKDRYPTTPILQKPFKVQALLALVDATIKTQGKGGDRVAAKGRAAEESARVDALLPGYVPWPLINHSAK